MQLHYEELGEGNPIIILHGLYGSSNNWLNVGKKLADSYKVYLIDQRNHGNSSHAESHTYEDMMEDLRSFIDEKKLQDIVLIGHSMGGKTAMLYTISYAEMIKNLIVVDISPRNYNIIVNNTIQTSDHKLILEAMNKLDLNAVTSRSKAIEMLSKDIPDINLCQFLLKNLRRNKNHTYEWKINLNAINTNITNMLSGVSRGNNDMPNHSVLFVRAENSRYIMDDDYFLIRKIFPKTEIVTIPDAGHWVHVEQPDLLIKTICYFIN